MAKQMSFEQKAKKEKKQVVCPVCHGPVQYIRLVKTVKSQTKGSWKFSDRNVGVCKCNQAEIYKV